MVVLQSSFVVVVAGETGDRVVKKLIIPVIVGPNASITNQQLSHAMDSVGIHAVGAGSGICCRGWFDTPCHGGWHLQIR